MCVSASRSTRQTTEQRRRHAWRQVFRRQSASWRNRLRRCDLPTLLFLIDCVSLHLVSDCAVWVPLQQSLNVVISTAAKSDIKRSVQELRGTIRDTLQQMDEADRSPGGSRHLGHALTEADWAEHISELEDAVEVAESNLKILPVPMTAAAAASVTRDPVTNGLVPQVAGTVYERLTAPSPEGLKATASDDLDDGVTGGDDMEEHDHTTAAVYERLTAPSPKGLEAVASGELDDGVTGGDSMEEHDRATAAVHELDSKVFVELRRLLIETDTLRTGFASKQQVRVHGTHDDAAPCCATRSSQHLIWVLPFVCARR